MALHYRIYPEERILVVRSEGIVTQPERVQTLLAWLADPEYQTCIGALCDFSESESTPERAEMLELLDLLARHRPAGGPTKVAIVAPMIITFGVARVFEDMVDSSAIPLEVKVFDDPELAWAWLAPSGQAI